MSKLVLDLLSQEWLLKEVADRYFFAALNAAVVSLHFNGHFFPCGSGLAGNRIALFWMLLEVRVMTTGAMRSAKLQSNHTTNSPTPNFLQVGCPSLSPSQQCQSTEWKQ